MIDPSTINFLTLPSVPIEMRLQLPSTSCIYFVIDRQDVILYIGQSVNLKRRWRNHRKTVEVTALPGIRIAYLSIDAFELLPKIEKALINWFNPPLNATDKSLKNLNREGKPPSEKIFGEPKKKRTLSVTDTGWQSASKKIKQMGYSSVSEFLEKWGRQV